MHTSLMSKNAPQDIEEDDDGLSEIEGRNDLEFESQHDEHDVDDELSSDDEVENDDRSIEANHSRGSSRENSFSAASSPPSPAPRPRREKPAPAREPTIVPTPVIHVHRDPKVEATKRRIQENLTLRNAGPSSHASYRGGGGTSYRGGGGHSKPGGGNHNHKRARSYEGPQPRDSNRRDSGPNQGTGGGGGGPANVPGQGPGNTPN